ncbi:MAG: hypothetical protein HN742_40250 [Lentisphaerae bacterium]|nr:hypothetical protein [Lentisphaerota bacterium]MBT5606969.1 hypothetical protein [Lentisphaerota bacterium]MBT7056996.1 hypothetical protein [Lentisphaerota bacterium]MBT7848168.1 hypothetical protein [Lentisphaerota bacterium]
MGLLDTKRYLRGISLDRGDVASSEHYVVARAFLNRPDVMLKELLQE